MSKIRFTELPIGDNPPSGKHYIGVDSVDGKLYHQDSNGVITKLDLSALGDLSQIDIDTLAEINAILTDANLIDTNDPRLSDARTPTAHTHIVAEITDFDSGVSNNATVDANTTKLAGIEAGATGDQTGAEIKSLYEAELNTNAFTDSDKSKLDGIEAGAEVNVQSDWNAVSGDALIQNKPTTITAQQSTDITTNNSKISADGSIDTHSDVDTTGKADGQSLKWDAVGGKWIPTTPANGDVLSTNNLSDLSNVATARTNLNVDVAGTDNAPDSTTTTKGKIEIATQTEVNTGTDSTRAITPSTLAGSTLASDVSTNNAKVSFPEAPNDGQEYVRKNLAWTVATGGGGGGAWFPPCFPLTALMSSGASYFVNGGAGVYLSFDGMSDDSAFVNLHLDCNGINYDGSNLAIKLHWRLSISGVANDTVGWLVDYAFVKDGDNSTTTVTNMAQQDIDVSTEVADVMFTTQLATMTGVVGAKNLMLSLTRNATGQGADSYTGSAELINIELVKV